MRGVVVGADVGGTSTRVAAATLDGTVVALARGDAGNPNAVGLNTAADRIRDTVAQCLGGIRDPVRAVVVGMAGGSRAAADPGFLPAVLPPELAAPARLVGDLEIAFASATPERSGAVLIAGTGSIAGRVRDGVLTARRHGWGWLLGDDGAGFWLGRELVRGTLRVLESGAPPTPLQEAVLRIAGAADVSGLIERCYAEPPIWLASLSVLLAEHPQDPAGCELTEAAVQHLLGLLDGVAPDPDEPLVLAGSVITAPGPVSAAFAAAVAARHPGPLLTARTGVVGALWIALQSQDHPPAAVHERLVESLAGRTG
jgi:N-acetylglucosamine kinase-like BadF-type ATPase